ncbi:hypothetical protein ACTQ33_01000 [Candidatus Avoscillospira sp. LCP25S3_F1]|uniref:hypothetical protein n=1 Tax=Candidatus Avoscillospira sp. LCP25S3_F1 TaxID=3438825 RepID=UPI003F8F389D
MSLDNVTRAQIAIAMRNGQELELQCGNICLLVSSGGGPWGQEMICGAVVSFPGGLCRKWCRSVAELEEFLEGKDERHEK